MTRVFVYGTLVASGVRIAVCPSARVLGEDRIEGWTMLNRHGLPTIVHHGEGRWTPGLVLEVDDDGLRALDIYESVDHDLYHREEVTGESFGPMIAYVMSDRWVNRP